MSGAAWNPKNKTLEELFEELVIKKNEYYDLDIKPTANTTPIPQPTDLPHTK